jgi:hypothetical protein
MNSIKNEKQMHSRREQWRELLAKQSQSGLSIQAFCARQGLREKAFYYWRRLLRSAEPVAFALVETGTAQRSGEARLELHLASGERLEIAPGVDAASLRLVLAVLRERA